MRLFWIAVAIAWLGYCDVEGRVSINGIQTGLSRIGGNFARIPVELDDVARIAGYNFAALGTYWRSNTLAGFAQMKRGEMQEAMETFNLAVATLAVWDLGQGVLYQIADTLVNKVILKYQDDFQRTLNAFFDYNKFMGAEFLSGSTTVGESKVLKAKLMDAQGDIAKAFQLDVETGMTKFTKNSQIYADLVTDLKGIKTWAKVAKYADVLAGPLFDAATVAVSAWQLAEAIKNKDPVAIGSSSLALASGLAGLTGFVVGALATAGSTLAAVAGPIGAIIGAVLGIASILVEIFGSLNPYPRIDNDIDMLNQLKVVSKQVLDADFQNLEKVIPSAANFEFSWIYEVNQGHLIEYIRGRGDYNEPVKFRLDKTGRAEDGYMVVGEMQVFDKGNYPGNFFWNPSGTVNLGYDFYGKKSTEELKGVTVIAGTNLVSGKGVELKGLDIVTYETTEDNFPDSVVIDDMYDIAFQNNIAAETGAGSDVIAINGLIGKPGHSDYHQGYGAKLSISTTVDGERPLLFKLLLSGGS